MSKDKYADFVEHPRYGRRPNLTGLNPQQFEKGAYLHCNASRGECIPNTAIEADLTRQAPATVAVTHYFDETRRCEDCGRSFIFFAEEQKFWYEELGFGLDSDCIRCFPCRKNQRGADRTRARYQELFHKPDKTANEQLELAECSLELMERGEFSTKQTQNVRRIVNFVSEHNQEDYSQKIAAISSRVREIELRDPESTK